MNNKIVVKVYPTKEEAAKEIAAEIAALIRARAAEGREAVLGLATGSTPVVLYKELIRLHKEEGLSFKNVTTFNLDEYYGLDGTHDQSYRYFMNSELFDHVDIDKEKTHVPDGTVPPDRVTEMCEKYDADIKAAGGIDIQILGIGRTGHIGFNEPPCGPETRTHQVKLNDLTIKDNARLFFHGKIEEVPTSAVTMGVGTILDSRKIVLLAWGEGKADIIYKSLMEPPTEKCPASWLQKHGNCVFAVDADAASKL